MAQTKEDKLRIAENVLAFVDRVTDKKRKTRVKSEHYKGITVTNELEFRRLYKKLMKVEEFAFDTEFSSLRMQYKGESELVGVSFSWGKDNNYYVPVGSWVNSNREQIPMWLFKRLMRRVFARTDIRIVGHNLKAELHALANVDIEVKTNDLFDTMIAVWNIDENNLIGLKEITERYYGYHQTHFKDLLLTIPDSVKVEFGYKKTYKGDATLVDQYIMSPYAMDDTYWTWKIYVDIMDALEDEKIMPYFFKRQMPYLRVLFNMERRGVPVDFERLKRMAKMAEKDLADLEYKIFELVGLEFSITSGQQLAELLFGWEKQKPIYEKIYEPIIDPKTGEQGVYKTGPRKGELKWKEKNNKNKIIGYEPAGNKHLIEASYKFPMGAVSEKTGQPKTGSDELDEILKRNYKKSKKKKEGQEFVRLVLRYKRLEKLRSTYMEGLAEQVYSDGRIHCSFNQTGTTSGRLSSSEPNLQNLPRPIEDVKEPQREWFDNEEAFRSAWAIYKEEKAEYDFWKRYEIRDAFVVPGDAKEEIDMTAHDFSNLEMRILTHFSQDPLLISMFARNVDSHGDTAVNMFKLDCTAEEAKKKYPKQRQQAKTINFLLVYGGSPSALSSQLGVSKDEAQTLYDMYFATYKGVAKYMKSQKKFAHRHGVVYTVLGRKRHLDGINDSDYGTRGYNERLAVNAPIQGSAADITISAQLIIEHDPLLNELGYEQVLQVHDEIVGLVPARNRERAMERVQEIMANCLPQPMNNIELRADGDYGKTYAEAK
ncbi:DNA polymerase [Bacillus phage BCD7]|uniref:Putative DNA polymerase I n=1 Tax=Bacillus phage BCD7 TaxID=1136534 RepID=J9PVA4_9CAUD|nr:DNA polymerase [Bacillus phage BCD7]AEZ50500.1 putative DNA polymerase I [Bacillus phage BCD7]